MKFLLVASFPQTIFKFRGNLIKEIQSKGFEVHIAAPFSTISETDKDLINLKKLNVKMHDIPLDRRGLNILKDIKLFYNLLKIVYKIKPHHLLAYTIKPVIYGTISAYILRVPKRFAMITGLGIIYTNSYEKQVSRTIKIIINALYKVSLKLATRVIFQNKDDKYLFESLKIVSKDKTLLVNGSGIDLELYKASPYPKKLNFLFIGRFIISKGIREFISAAKIVKKIHPDVNFTIVGWYEDDEDSIQKEEIKKFTDTGIIRNLGFLDDIQNAMQDASVFVLPSYREGTPRSVLEAMAMGRSIITSDAPGCRETVVNNYNGFLVPVNSVENLVKAISYFINNPNSIHIMGKNSLKLVTEKYDVKIVNKYMIEIMGI